MGSATETFAAGAPTAPARATRVLAAWNRRLHYYVGLYLLFFVWLFAFTGLLLNHPKWSFAEFWPQRRQTTYAREIVAPAPGSDLAQARDLARQLGVPGEIEWTTSREDARRFEFRVSRPGHILEVKTDLALLRATVHETDLNAWGVLHILHTFTGVRMDDPRNTRDWVLTSVWALAMDAVAAGLIFMVLSSLYMWYELRERRLLGALLLALGWLGCAWFCVGLRWLY